ncbi:hypothetical protein DCC27_003835 [Auritidibacter sp. NML130574]|nr:hypothetical protein DCC27_003835 [Auritidibacter sp. NML130574]
MASIFRPRTVTIPEEHLDELDTVVRGMQQRYGEQAATFGDELWTVEGQPQLGPEPCGSGDSFRYTTTFSILEDDLSAQAQQQVVEDFQDLADELRLSPTEGNPPELSASD